jgi:hypothetical protein
LIGFGNLGLGKNLKELGLCGLLVGTEFNGDRDVKEVWEGI